MYFERYATIADTSPRNSCIRQLPLADVVLCSDTTSRKQYRWKSDEIRQYPFVPPPIILTVIRIGINCSVRKTKIRNISSVASTKSTQRSRVNTPHTTPKNIPHTNTRTIISLLYCIVCYRTTKRRTLPSFSCHSIQKVKINRRPLKSKTFFGSLLPNLTEEPQ